MALQAVTFKMGQSLGEGRSQLTPTGGRVPDIATILTDITAALAVTAIAGDAPSTTAVTLVQTDATALIATINNDVTIIWNKTNVTHRNQLRRALQAALREVESGIGGLAE